MSSWVWRTARSHREPYWESKEPGKPQESGFLPKKSKSSARNVLEDSLDGQIFGQNGMCQKSADVYLFCNFLDSYTIFLHHHSIHFGNDLVISAWWRPAKALLPIHRCAAICKLVVPLLNLCDAHSIITESYLNLLSGFHLVVAQFLAKFDAVALLQLFCPFPYNENPTRALNTYITEMLLAITWRYWQMGKNLCISMKVQGHLVQVRFIEIHQVCAKKKSNTFLTDVIGIYIPRFIYIFVFLCFFNSSFHI